MPAIAALMPPHTYTSAYDYFRDYLKEATEQAVAESTHTLCDLAGSLEPWQPSEPLDSVMEQRGIERVACYVRESTKGQTEALTDGLHDLLGTADQHGLKLTAVFWDIESGTESDELRTGLAELKAHVENNPGDVQGVLVWNMNRFARDFRIGYSDAEFLSDHGAPVIFPRRNSLKRLTIGDWDNSDDRMDCIEALDSAEVDLREHEAKTLRGYMMKLRAGIYPFGRVPKWVFFDFIKSKTATTQQNKPAPEIHVAEDAQKKMRASIALILAFPDQATLDELARLYGRTTKQFVEELRNPTLKGDFRLGKLLDDEVMEPHEIERLRLLSDEEWDDLQSALNIAIGSVEKPEKKQSQVSKLIETRSAEYIVSVLNEHISPWCSRGLDDGSTCGKRMTLHEADTDERPGQDKWICPDGHKGRRPSARGRDEIHRLRFPASCPLCETWEFVDTDHETSRIEDKKVQKFSCSRCNGEFWSTHEVRAEQRHHRRFKQPADQIEVPLNRIASLLEFN